MEIEAKAVERLKQYFYNVNWLENTSKAREEITEEILFELFRKIGCLETDTISLVKYQEHELAPNYCDPGFLHIRLELRGEDDFYYFHYNYHRDITTYEEQESCEIDFNNIRKYRSFTFNPVTREWSLLGYSK